MHKHISRGRWYFHSLNEIITFTSSLLSLQTQTHVHTTRHADSDTLRHEGKLRDLKIAIHCSKHQQIVVKHINALFLCAATKCLTPIGRTFRHRASLLRRRDVKDQAIFRTANEFPATLNPLTFTRYNENLVFLSKAISLELINGRWSFTRSMSTLIIAEKCQVAQSPLKTIAGNWDRLIAFVSNPLRNTKSNEKRLLYDRFPFQSNRMQMARRLMNEFVLLFALSSRFSNSFRLIALGNQDFQATQNKNSLSFIVRCRSYQTALIAKTLLKKFLRSPRINLHAWRRRNLEQLEPIVQHHLQSNNPCWFLMFLLNLLCRKQFKVRARLYFTWTNKSDHDSMVKCLFWKNILLIILPLSRVAPRHCARFTFSRLVAISDFSPVFEANKQQ